MTEWPRFLPDLTLWHDWHADRGTLPGRWAGQDLAGVCRSLGVPAWAPRRPWRIALPGIEVRDERGASERVLTWGTPRGTLRSRWTLGPDGDWWQAEYPVKSREDFEAARLVVEARRYDLAADRAKAAAPGEIAALELPRRPWSELFHGFLGWSDGLMLFLEEAEALQGLVGILEEKLVRLQEDLAGLPGEAALLPDNLDGQFISPPAFEENLAASYARAASTLHGGGKTVVVHAGGPVSRLLPGLAACGIDCVEGVCGPPQGDSTLEAAREACGPGLVLWGGIAQDLLLPSSTEGELRAAAAESLGLAARDRAVVVGVADMVPTGALPDRLVLLAEMAGRDR